MKKQRTREPPPNGRITPEEWDARWRAAVKIAKGTPHTKGEFWAIGLAIIGGILAMVSMPLVVELTVRAFP